MFLLNLPLNLKEHAAIERRQHEEKQRLARIFDEKFRTIGVWRKIFWIETHEWLYESNIDW